MIDQCNKMEREKAKGLLSRREFMDWCVTVGLAILVGLGIRSCIRISESERLEEGEESEELRRERRRSRWQEGLDQWRRLNDPSHPRYLQRGGPEGPF